MTGFKAGDITCMRGPIKFKNVIRALVEVAGMEDNSVAVRDAILAAAL